MGHEDVDAVEQDRSVRFAGEEVFERGVRHVEVTCPCADKEVGFEAPVEVRAPGRDDVVSLCHLREPSAFLGRVAPVIALHPCEPLGGELLEDAVKARRVETERQRVGERHDCPRVGLPRR